MNTRFPDACCITATGMQSCNVQPAVINQPAQGWIAYAQHKSYTVLERCNNRALDQPLPVRAWPVVDAGLASA